MNLFYAYGGFHFRQFRILFRSVLITLAERMHIVSSFNSMIASHGLLGCKAMLVPCDRAPFQRDVPLCLSPASAGFFVGFQTACCCNPEPRTQQNCYLCLIYWLCANVRPVESYEKAVISLVPDNNVKRAMWTRFYQSVTCTYRHLHLYIYI
jgi:hypothetical protein